VRIWHFLWAVADLTVLYERQRSVIPRYLIVVRTGCMSQPQKRRLKCHQVVVGYPPCPHLDYLKTFIEEHHGLPVVVGTHPIPEKYLIGHGDLESVGTLQRFHDLMATPEIRKDYD